MIGWGVFWSEYLTSVESPILVDGVTAQSDAPRTASQEQGRNFYVKAWFKVIAVCGAVKDPSRSSSGLV
jgi:hypothetical protein